ATSGPPGWPSGKPRRRRGELAIEVCLALGTSAGNPRRVGLLVTRRRYPGARNAGNTRPFMGPLARGADLDDRSARKHDGNHRHQRQRLAAALRGRRKKLKKGGGLNVSLAHAGST